MAGFATVLLLAWLAVSGVHCECTTRDFATQSSRQREPFSTGRFKLSYQRPTPECRTVVSHEVEDVLDDMKKVVVDPDLFRLFENTYPNTLDTTIKWQGMANGTDQELAFIITGDINAMWLRDSANQLQQYAPLLLRAKNTEVGAVFRGAINLHARYLLIDAFCNAFQPPEESGMTPQINAVDTVFPTYDLNKVYQCSYQLDSMGSFLQLSVDYFNNTQDFDFFKKHNWTKAVENVMDTAELMMKPTYSLDGGVNASPYTFVYCSGTLLNSGVGSPVNAGTGLIRSAFRPSDDPCIYQFLIPSNMYFSAYLRQAAEIMAGIDVKIATRMRDMSSKLHDAIEKHGIVNHTVHGRIYAYEVDGYGSMNIMDDANTPSLLSAPLMGYLDIHNEVYQNTRKMILSTSNPYWAKGPVLNAVGGPHVGLGMGWPMASIVRIMTSDNDTEIIVALKEILSSTDGLGLIHESVSASSDKRWSRQWFAWANSMFAKMMLDLRDNRRDILAHSFQN